MSEFDKKTAEKLEKDYKQKLENVKTVDRQMREFKNKYVEQMQDDFLEGQLLKKQVEENIEAEQQKELDRKLRDRQIMEAQLKANKDLEDIKRQQKIKEEQDDKEIEKFAKNKDRLDQLRKEKESDKMKKVSHSSSNFIQKQEEKQRLIDRQIEYLEKKQNKEEEILSNQIRDAERKAEEAFRIKEARRKQMEEVGF